MIPHKAKETEYHFELQLLNLENKIMASSFAQELNLQQPSSLSLQSSAMPDKTVEIVSDEMRMISNLVIDRFF